MLVLTLCLIAALVVDIGGLRMDHRNERSSADAGATAGAAYLNPADPESARNACRNAFEYVLANLDDEGSTFTRPTCSALVGQCTSATPQSSVSGVAGRYTITITYPVSDTSSLMHPDVAPGYSAATQPLNSSYDGLQCQRLGVEVQARRDFVLGPAGRFKGRSTSIHSVARSDVYGGPSVVAPLVVLDPYHCNSLVTSGQGDIRVLNNGNLPGIIAVDSDATKDLNPLRCDSPNQYVIDSSNGSNGRILAYPGDDGSPPFIYSYALFGSREDHAYDPGDVVPGCQPPSGIVSLSGKLCPRPTGISERITRKPWDDRYGAFIASVRADYDNVASPHAPPATGVWTTYTSSNSFCKNNPPNFIFPAGNYLFDCTPIVKNAIWRFLPGSTVVFAGNITTATGGCIYFNATDTTTNANLACPAGAVTEPSTDMVVYIRRGTGGQDKGTLAKDSDGSLIAARTAIIQSGDDSTPDLGHFNLNGGNGRIYWTALRDTTTPTRSGLAYWSEGRSYPHDGEPTGITASHNLGGQSNVTVTGVMFMPNAQVDFSGQTGDAQFVAQFVAYRVNNKGQSTIKLVPDISNAVAIPIIGVHLIR
jgi:hypothetical protein